jgi:hypothetical protein
MSPKKQPMITTGSSLPKANVPFQRIDPSKVIFANEKAKSSVYTDPNELGVYKGKSFRQEKNKKKRGSFRGGPIDQTVRSIKFDSD